MFADRHTINSLVFGQPDDVAVGDGTLARARRATEHDGQLVRDKRVEEEGLNGRVSSRDDHVTRLQKQGRITRSIALQHQLLAALIEE